MYLEDFDIAETDDAIRLSIALASGQSLPVVRSIIDSKSRLLKYRLPHVLPCGRRIRQTPPKLAIHFSCRNKKVSDEVVGLVAEKFPQGLAVSCLSNNRFLPIHEYIMNRTLKFSLETLEKLVELYPKSLDHQTKYGALISLALGCEVGSDIIQFCIRSSPESLKIPCERGYLPLHIICSMRNADPGVFKMVFNACPEASNVMTDDKGYLPWHLCRQEWKLKILFHQSPFSVLLCNPSVSRHFPLSLSCEKMIGEHEGHAQKQLSAIRTTLKMIAFRLNIPDEIVQTIWYFIVPIALDIPYNKKTMGDRVNNPCVN